MSKIRKAMMGRYIILMIVLVISLSALMLSAKNYHEIQRSKKEIDAILEKTSMPIGTKILNTEKFDLG